MAVPFKPGDIFNERFVVEEELGSGGQATVYSAKDRSTGGRVALKVLRPEMVKDVQLRARFLRDVKVAERVDHRGIVRVFDSGVNENNVPWIAMECLEGRTLADYVDANGGQTIEWVRSVLSQLQDAVVALHSSGIVHCDLTPKNIFLVRQPQDAEPKLTLLDFGISKLQGQSTLGQTQLLGTPGWMAPEQFDSRDMDRTTDVWTFGLIAFYVLVGRPYWKNLTSATYLKEIQSESREDASVRAAIFGLNLPGGFDRWFARCISYEPTGRFASINEAWREYDMLGVPDAHARTEISRNSHERDHVAFVSSPQVHPAELTPRPEPVTHIYYRCDLIVREPDPTSRDGSRRDSRRCTVRVVSEDLYHAAFQPQDEQLFLNGVLKIFREDAKAQLSDPDPRRIEVRNTGADLSFDRTWVRVTADNLSIWGMAVTLPIVNVPGLYSLKDIANDIARFLNLAASHLREKPAIVWFELFASEIGFVWQSSEAIYAGRLGVEPASKPGAPQQAFIQKVFDAGGLLGNNVEATTAELLQIALTRVHRERLERSQLARLLAGTK